MQRRLNIWFAGDFDSLVIEGGNIQAKMPNFKSTKSPDHLAKSFTKLMLEGKVHTVIRMLDDENSRRILNLTDTISS